LTASPLILLDYASPRKRLKLRMPAKSILDICHDDGRVSVIERLKGRGEAIGAMCFAGFMLLYMAALMVAERRHGAAWVLGPFWIAEASVFMLVIHQTWRKTLLVVTPESVSLRFTSPLTRSAFEWPVMHVGDVLAVVTANPGSTRPLAELRLRFTTGGEAQLFTDHPAAEINDLAEAIRNVLEPQTATPPPELAARDPTAEAQQTMDRLVVLHRAMRGEGAEL
jgi:hypothetical protein